MQFSHVRSSFLWLWLVEYGLPWTGKAKAVALAIAALIAIVLGLKVDQAIVDLRSKRATPEEEAEVSGWPQLLGLPGKAGWSSYLATSWNTMRTTAIGEYGCLTVGRGMSNRICW
jgi:hypothetical protein